MNKLIDIETIKKLEWCHRDPSITRVTGNVKFCPLCYESEKDGHIPSCYFNNKSNS